MLHLFITYLIIVGRDGRITQTRSGPGRTHIIRAGLNLYRSIKKSESGIDFCDLDLIIIYEYKKQKMRKTKQTLHPTTAVSSPIHSPKFNK